MALPSYLSTFLLVWPYTLQLLDLEVTAYINGELDIGLHWHILWRAYSAGTCFVCMFCFFNWAVVIIFLRWVVTWCHICRLVRLVDHCGTSLRTNYNFPLPSWLYILLKLLFCIFILSPVIVPCLLPNFPGSSGNDFPSMSSFLTHSTVDETFFICTALTFGLCLLYLQKDGGNYLSVMIYLATWKPWVFGMWTQYQHRIYKYKLYACFKLW